MQSSIVYGKHATLLACNKRPESIIRILIAKKEDFIVFNPNLHKKIEIVSNTVLNKISDNHNGFACYIKPMPKIHEDELFEMQNILVLDCVQDIGNIGAIMRTAGAFNIDAVVYTTNKMPDISNNQTVAKLSSGGIEMVKLCQVTNLYRTIENLKKENFWVIGTDANGNDVKDLAEKYKNSKKVIIFGNEESGIKPVIKKSCDVIASIQINTQIDSLNVSVAAGIVLWEMIGKYF